MRRSFFFAIATLSFACGATGASDSSDRPGSSVTPASCDPGTRPLSVGGCGPVGTTSVPAGFVPDGAKGFRAMLPAAACTGATRAVLGSATCQPIDDCTAAFPPMAATVAVRANATPYADRPDVTVVTTLDEALKKVAAGGTIAVDEGEFATPAALSQSVTVVGKCAARTSLKGDGFGIHTTSAVTATFKSMSFTGAPMVALLIDAHAKVTLDQVYVHGDNNAADVGNGATLTVHRSVFEGPSATDNPNAATNGVQAIYGGLIALDDVELRGYQNAIYAQSAKSVITVSKSVVRGQVGQKAEKESLAAIAAFTGATVTIDGSHVESEPGRVALVGAQLTNGQKDATSPSNPPAHLSITNGTVLQALVRREAGSVVDVINGADLTLDNVSLHHDSFVALSGSESAKISVSRSVITAEPSAGNARTALSGLSGATFALDGTAIIGSTSQAVLLNGASSATITKSLIIGNREIAAPDVTALAGAGQALSVAPDGKATLSDSALMDNEGTAVFLQGASAELDNVVVARTHASSVSARGIAVMAIDAAVLIRTSNLYRNDLALGIRRGRALLRDSTVGSHAEVARLDGVSFVQTNDAVDDAQDQKLIAARSTFTANAILVSPKGLTDE